MRNEGRSGQTDRRVDLQVILREGHVFMKVGVLRVSVPAAHGAEHHVATRDFALVHLAQVHSLVVHAQGPFVAVHFVADVTEEPTAVAITAPSGRKEEWRGGSVQPLNPSFF